MHHIAMGQHLNSQKLFLLSSCLEGLQHTPLNLLKVFLKGPGTNPFI